MLQGHIYNKNWTIFLNGFPSLHLYNIQLDQHIMLLHQELLYQIILYFQVMFQNVLYFFVILKV